MRRMKGDIGVIWRMLSVRKASGVSSPNMAQGFPLCGVPSVIKVFTRWCPAKSLM